VERGQLDGIRIKKKKKKRNVLMRENCKRGGKSRLKRVKQKNKGIRRKAGTGKEKQRHRSKGKGRPRPRKGKKELVKWVKLVQRQVSNRTIYQGGGGGQKENIRKSNEREGVRSRKRWGKRETQKNGCVRLKSRAMFKGQPTRRGGEKGGFLQGYLWKVGKQKNCPGEGKHLMWGLQPREGESGSKIIIQRIAKKKRGQSTTETLENKKKRFELRKGAAYGQGKDNWEMEVGSGTRRQATLNESTGG